MQPIVQIKQPSELKVHAHKYTYDISDTPTIVYSKTMKTQFRGKESGK